MPLQTLSARRVLIAALLLVVAGAVLWVSGYFAEQRVGRDLAAEASRSAALFDALLASDVERYRALPLALATDGEVRAALQAGDTAARTRLGDRLDQLAGRLDAAAIYVIGADGITIAASNARTPASFVGKDYRFRSYFRDAMASGFGAQFALGSTTRRPGLYLAQRIDAAGEKALGVLVVKAEFLRLEADWKRSGKPAFVADKDGRILITSVADWRFRQVGAIARPLPVAGGKAQLTLPGTRIQQGFQVARQQTIVPGWTLTVLAPRDRRVDEAVSAARALSLLGIGTTLAGAFWLWRRAGRQRAHVRAAEAARQVLEARVADRTAALSEVNTQMLLEIDERRRAEAETRLLHQELEQANRLATLGQIAAGVTHEINQPVAAIRATADNAKILLDRHEIAAAQSAIDTIARLTERIGSITGELRSFAAKSHGKARVVSVDTAIDGALLLLGPALQAQATKLVRQKRRPDLKVRADRVRVEQILVNLLQNALDAVAGAEHREVRIELTGDDDMVDVRVSDSGPGLSESIAALLFTPFRTSKPHGLGLGLVISRDIATALGGELDVIASDPGKRGATFRLRLPAAQ